MDCRNHRGLAASERRRSRSRQQPGPFRAALLALPGGPTAARSDGDCRTACRATEPHCIKLVTADMVVEAALDLLHKPVGPDKTLEAQRPRNHTGGNSLSPMTRPVLEAARRSMMRSSVAWWQSRGGRIAAAASSGAAARVLSSLLTLVSLPLAVRYLGAERFGVWATITSTVVFLNLLDLGIASTLTNHVARATRWDDKQYAARYTTNALALTASHRAVSPDWSFAVAWPHIDWMALFNVAASVSRASK